MRLIRQACLALIVVLASPMAQAANFAVMRLEQAAFSMDAGVTSQPVSLPDTWSDRGIRSIDPARYSIDFDLRAAALGTPTALLLTRVSSHHRIHLNGQLIAEQGDVPGLTNRRALVPALFELPDGLLRAGRNHLTLDVVHKSRGGLSVVELGPTTGLRARFEQVTLIEETLPRALNMAMVGLSLFMLAIWWRRRSESALGSFGGLALVGALRNHAYAGQYLFLPLWLYDWLIFSSQVVTAVLLGVFAQAITGRRPAYQRFLMTLLIVAPLLGLAGSLLDHERVPTAAGSVGSLDLMTQLRRFVYPVLAVATLAGLAALVRHGLAARRALNPLPTLGMATLILCGIHDYGFQTGWLAVTGRFWLPLALPIVLGGIAMMLLTRMVGAMGEVEALNVELDQRVALRTRELEAANAAKTRFLAAASHDLRQPVAAVGLMIGMAQEEARSQPALAAMLDRARSATSLLESLLRDLLDLSRVESASGAAIAITFPLARLFDAIALHESPQAAARGLVLRCRDRGQVVRCDPVLLEQMLRNLVNNAVRFTERGGVLVTARPRHGGQVLVQVWDTGRGIAPELLQSAFEAFVQLDAHRSAPGQGVGLGLAIVRRSAELMGARLDMRSRPGLGTCVSIWLPTGDMAPASMTDTA